MKPLAFRVQDFRSIKDTGVCSLAGDNVTILAGQNEAGKSAVLMALRDFDLEEGKSPLTPEYTPEGNDDAEPRVSVLFEYDDDWITSALAEDGVALPEAVREHLKAQGQWWIGRDLDTGKFSPSDEISKLWPKVETKPAQANPAQQGAPQAQPQPAQPKILPIVNFGQRFRLLWPQFVYFDLFQDQLPRQIAVEALHQNIQARKAKGQQPTQSQPGQNSVEDYLELAGVDLNEVLRLKDQDKVLSNYLKRKAAGISGDFLNYWKQSVDGTQKVELHVRHARNAQGVLQLAFYVHDGVDQYPEQRSKGFLWFLSFYLRLAAEEKRNPNGNRLLLIDEPGTYLHAKAQRDVLHLIEDKLAPEQQVIYSTHSPYLLPTDKLHRLRIVFRHGQRGTIVVDRLTHPDLRGEEFADTLSPVISAIGLDIRDRIGGLTDKNLLVEGLSDHTYLTTWLAQLKSPLQTKVCVFPGTSAGSLPTLGSLCIGWGLKFSVLLDRDDAGLKTAEKFANKLGLSSKRIIHPDNAVTIEDVFDAGEFTALLAKLDPSLNLKASETPSKGIRRQNVDKILLARKFAESPASFPKSAINFGRLLQTIEKSFE